MLTQTSTIDIVIDQHWNLGHAYADDHQVYCGFIPDSMGKIVSPWNGASVTSIAVMKSDMKIMKPKMNYSKTEYLLIDTPQQLPKCTNTAINIGDNEVHATKCVRNLDAYFDKHMIDIWNNITSPKCRAAYMHNYTFIIGKI